MKNAFQHVSEWESLLRSLVRINNFIEIGFFKGGTFESLCEITSGKKISIDYCDGTFGGIGAVEKNKAKERILNKSFVSAQNTYFIEGDSHKIEVVKQLSDILNGSQVDFLFIDGDHTYNGVLADYMIYRQFVKQGGYIAFHDVIESEFHTNAGCFVSELWKKLKGVEFVSLDNSDVSDDAKNIGSNIFGGIGLMKNDFTETNYHIFQVIHDQRSIDLCVGVVEDYIPTLIFNENTQFFENSVISKVQKLYKFPENDYIGITSPIVTMKSGLTIDELISQTNGFDVFNYGDVNTIADGNTNVWTENGNGRKGTNLFESAIQLNDSKILPFDIFEKGWTCIYCNYFICKVSIFENYVESVLNPVMEWLKKTNWIKSGIPKWGLMHRNKWYPISVFLCECMFGMFLARNNFKINGMRGKVNPKGKILTNLK